MEKRGEKQVMSLMEEHLSNVEVGLQNMLSVVESYFSGDLDSAESFTGKVHNAEETADDIRREISEMLHTGAFLPIFREDVIKLVGMMDTIIGCAQQCCRFITIQRPDVPDELKESFREVTRKSVAILSPLQESVENLSKDFDVIAEKVNEVHRLESELDHSEWELSRRIFSTDLPLANKMHLRQLVDMILDISDITEDSAEVLEALVAKKQV